MPLSCILNPEYKITKGDFFNIFYYLYIGAACRGGCPPLDVLTAAVS